MSLNPSCIEALQKIAEIVLPERISWRDVAKHATGYSKEKAIEQLLEAAKQDPFMTRLKLFLIHAELDKLRNNGGLLSE